MTNLTNHFQIIALCLTLLMLISCAGGEQTSSDDKQKSTKNNVNDSGGSVSLVKTSGEIIELKDFSAVEGKHCESTSIMNALKYQGLALNEATINGISASISFNLLKEGGFPFISARRINILDWFISSADLKCQKMYPQDNQSAYNMVKDLLKKGIPVVLQVDMKYLTYRWGGGYGQPFGAHFVTLVKIDENEGYAYVTETNEKGIKSVEKLKIDDLVKARASTDDKIEILHPNNHFYYFEDVETVNIDYKKALKLSLEKVIEEYKQNGALANLKAFPENINNIESYINTPYVLKPLFFTFYGYIEEFGNGGSAFRNFYRDYLIEMSDKLDISEAKETANQVDISCKKWTELALEFKNISETIERYYNNKDKRQELYKNASSLAEELVEAEKNMLESIKQLSKMI